MTRIRSAGDAVLGRLYQFQFGIALPAVLLTLALIVLVWWLAGGEASQNFAIDSTAVVLGVLIAFAVDRRWEDFKERMQEDKNRTRLLQFTRKELKEARECLMLRRNDNYAGFRQAMKSNPLPDTLWTALSDAGELAAVKNPKLLYRLSTAYLWIRHLRMLENQFLASDRPQSLDTAARSNITLDDLWKATEKAIEAVGLALEEVDGQPVAAPAKAATSARDAM